jgi:vancomycin resistance protein YoaR
MSEKYYQEYGPMRRRRGTQQRPPADPLDPVTEPLELEELEPEPEPGPRRPPPPRRRGRSRLRLALTTLLALGAILAIPYLVSFALPLLAGDRVPEGVTLQGQPIGGMQRAELVALLADQHGDFTDAPLTIEFEGQSWSPSMRDLGATLDLERTADLALGAGATSNPIERIRNWWLLSRGGLDIAPVMRVDALRIQGYLLSITPDVEQPPRDASLSLVAGKVLPTAARPGRQVLIDETTAEILRALQSLAPQRIPLRTRSLAPQIDDLAADDAITSARTLLKSPLRLRQASRDWTWDEERIASMVVVRKEGNQLIAAIDEERLARQVEKLAQVVDSGSSEPRLTFADGRLQIVEPGKTGIRLRQDAAVDMIMEALQSDLHAVELPTEAVEPQVTAATLPELGIIEQVAEGRSSFAGSAPYRVTNIKAGAQRMDGVLIPPDAEFSFNTQLGEVDEANGFVQGYAVIGNRTQLEWGGGVCQVSTTVFRAAFWGGLPITERHAHPFYISWYDAYSYPGDAAPGMDATIFTGVQDFKFVNDTGHWMLMQTVIDEANQVLSVRLYGTRPDRIVEVVGPEIDNVVPPPSRPVYVTDASLPAGTVKQTDTARKGMDIAVYRVIEEGGTKREPELFFTRFKSWPDVFVRGIGSP